MKTAAEHVDAILLAAKVPLFGHNIEDNYEAILAAVTAAMEDGGRINGELLDAQQHYLEVIEQTAQHWLTHVNNHPIAWEGGIDAAMKAACDTITTLRAQLADARQQALEYAQRLIDAETQLAKAEAERDRMREALAACDGLGTFAKSSDREIVLSFSSSDDGMIVFELLSDLIEDASATPPEGTSHDD